MMVGQAPVGAVSLLTGLARAFDFFIAPRMGQGKEGGERKGEKKACKEASERRRREEEEEEE
jgi:hypothetical protein